MTAIIPKDLATPEGSAPEELRPPFLAIPAATQRVPDIPVQEVWCPETQSVSPLPAPHLLTSSLPRAPSPKNAVTFQDRSKGQSLCGAAHSTPPTRITPLHEQRARLHPRTVTLRSHHDYRSSAPGVRQVLNCRDYAGVAMGVDLGLRY